MRVVWVLSEFLIIFLLPNFSSEKIINSSAYEMHEKYPNGSDQRRAVSEQEISYIASTLQPKECLSLLYLLHHAYKRRRRREFPVQKIQKNQIRSAQITPCETMLLNYWRDPKYKNEKDCYRVSRTLRQVKRQDLARWLYGRRPSCYSKSTNFNGTNDISSLTAQMQLIPIYASRPKTAERERTTSSGSNFESQSMIWIYIALAVLTTTSVLLCVNYLFQKFRKPCQYITLADKDMRNMQYPCGCGGKQVSLSCNRKKRYQPPIQPECTACLGN